MKQPESSNKRINLRHQPEPVYKNWIRVNFSHLTLSRATKFIELHPTTRIKRLEVHAPVDYISQTLVVNRCRAMSIFNTMVNVKQTRTNDIRGSRTTWAEASIDSTPKGWQVSIFTMDKLEQYTKQSPTQLGIGTPDERNNPLYSITKLTSSIKL